LALVERPVIYSVIRQIQDQTGISSRTAIRYYGEDAKAAQFNSTLTVNPEIHNRWPVVESLMVEVEEDFNTDRILNMMVKQPENPFIFLDSSLGFYIKPAYSTQDITIRFKYKARDRNQAIKWRNEIRTRIAMNRSNLMHEITYSYHLPEALLLLINDIYKLRENVAGYGDTFDEYLGTHSTSRMTVLSNQVGSQVIYAIAERQAEIVGSFDFEGFPEKPEKEGDNDQFEISFAYKFRYEKPIEVVCRYPFLVHQQFLADKYLPAMAYNIVDVAKRLSKSGTDFANFRIDNINEKAMADKGLTIPTYDDFLPAYIAPFSLRVLSALVSISAEDKRSLLSLKDLGFFNFRQEVLEFLVGEAPYMTLMMGSIFYCQLYENENMVEDGMLSIDSNLNVTATADLDLRKQYHVRISLIGDMSMVKSQALTRLRNFPSAIPTIIGAINAALRNSGNQTGFFKNSLSTNDYRLLGGTPPAMNGLGRSLVQYMYVVADRMSNYTAPTPPTPNANTTAMPNAAIFTNQGTGSP
jgi:hypothetical protein